MSSIFQKTHTEFSKLLEEGLEGSKYYEFHGPTQSRKTQAMISLIDYLLKKDETAKIAYISPNTHQSVSQLKKRIPCFSYVGTRSEPSSQSSRILVLLDNVSQLQKTLALLKDSKYYLIIDEVDDSQLVGYGSISYYLKQLYLGSVRTYGISATNMSTLWLQDDLSSKSFFYIKPDSEYKGLKDVNVHYLTPDSRTITDRHDDIFERDPYFFHDWIRWFAQKERVFYIDRLDKKLRSRPSLALYRGTYHNHSQLRVFIDIMAMNLSIDFVIAYNQKGIYVFAPRLGNFPGAQTLSFLHNTTEYIFFRFESSLTIGDVLQTIKDKNSSLNNGIIIAGKYADRCISYFSNDGLWHLDHMYAVLPQTKGSNTSRWIQILGRITGVYPRSNPNLHLWVHENVYKDCIKTMDMQELAYVNMKLEDTEVKTSSYTRSTVFPRDIVPSVNLATGVPNSWIRKESLPEEEKKMKVSIKESSLGLQPVLIDEERIRKGTKYYKTYHALVKLITEDKKENIWIDRSDLVVNLVLYMGEEAKSVHSHTTHLHQRLASTKENIVDTTPGLLYRKNDTTIQIRYNTSK